MSTVFLSYSRKDLPLIEQLEVQLKHYPEISVWRGQERIYGEQNWKQGLSNAIADQDVFLLAWSKHAAVSPQVEFEWHAALAQGKPIVVSLVDNTPLPPPLAEAPSYQPANSEGIANALGAVHFALARNTASFIEKESAQTNSATPSILVTPESGAKRPSFIDKWGPLLGFAASVATIVAVLTPLGQELFAKFGFTLFEDDDQVVEQILSGSVQDASTNQPLDRADVLLPEFGRTATTNPSGHFEFHVRAPKQDMVSVSARREGYNPSEIHKQILGDRKVIILLKKQAP